MLQFPPSYSTPSSTRSPNPPTMTGGGPRKLRLPPPSSTHALTTRCKSIPLSSKGTLGEDAFFHTTHSVGVADGVGGWSALGVDAGLYSRKLMENASRYSVESGDCDPKATLQAAFHGMGSTIGTTTACVVVLKNATLRIANLGDSGAMVFRRRSQRLNENNEYDDGEWGVLMKTAEQMHYFNCPIQLGTDARDYPNDAQEYEVLVEHGDLVLTVTDGVLDNLFEDQILALLNLHFPSAHSVARAKKFGNLATELQDLANALAEKALMVANDTECESPFSIGAQENRIPYVGGKQDDITVVISAVVSMGLNDSYTEGESLASATKKASMFARSSPSTSPNSTTLSPRPMEAENDAHELTAMEVEEYSMNDENQFWKVL